MITMWWFDINWIKFRMNSSILFWHRTVCRSYLPLLCVAQCAQRSIPSLHIHWLSPMTMTTTTSTTATPNNDCYLLNSKEEDTQDFPTKDRLTPYVQQKRHRMQQSHTWTKFGIEILEIGSIEWFHWIVWMMKLSSYATTTMHALVVDVSTLYKLPLPWIKNKFRICALFKPKSEAMG